MSGVKTKRKSDSGRMRQGRLGSMCRVRVDGAGNAQWLLTRLSRSFVFKSAAPLHHDVGTACSSFQVPYTSQVSRSVFERLLEAISEVNLMQEPA
jgi:hypothetical protein